MGKPAASTTPTENDKSGKNCFWIPRETAVPQLHWGGGWQACGRPGAIKLRNHILQLQRNLLLLLLIVVLRRLASSLMLHYRPLVILHITHSYSHSHSHILTHTRLKRINSKCPFLQFPIHSMTQAPQPGLLRIPLSTHCPDLLQ